MRSTDCLGPAVQLEDVLAQRSLTVVFVPTSTTGIIKVHDSFQTGIIANTGVCPIVVDRGRYALQL